VPIFCNPIAANTASSFWGLIDVYFIKKIYLTLDELQKDLDDWVVDYNTRRSHVSVNLTPSSQDFEAVA
jgi:transposase InsO family protein